MTLALKTLVLLGTGVPVVARRPCQRVEHAPDGRVAPVHGTWVFILAGQGVPGLAGPLVAQVAHGACIPVVAREAGRLGVDAPELEGAGVNGAGIAVVTRGRLSDTDTVHALVLVRALVAVVALGPVRLLVYTAGHGIAAVAGARIAVVAGNRCAGAGACGAVVFRGADGPVVARRALQHDEYAPEVRITVVAGAGIAVVTRDLRTRAHAVITRVFLGAYGPVIARDPSLDRVEAPIRRIAAVHGARVAIVAVDRLSFTPAQDARVIGRAGAIIVAGRTRERDRDAPLFRVARRLGALVVVVLADDRVPDATCPFAMIVLCTDVSVVAWRPVLRAHTCVHRGVVGRFGRVGRKVRSMPRIQGSFVTWAPFIQDVRGKVRFPSDIARTAARERAAQRGE